VGVPSVDEKISLCSFLMDETQGGLYFVVEFPSWMEKRILMVHIDETYDKL